MTHLTCGLIGRNIGQTRLPKALELMCRASKMYFNFTPIDTAAKPGFDFARTVDDLRTKNWTGVTVTHPFKPAAAQYAGRGMDRQVAHLGASNLLMFGDKTTGWNTDYLGFIAAWRAIFKSRGPGEVAVAGAGGVARAIIPALLRLGARKMTVWDKNPDAASDLARTISGSVSAIAMDDAPQAIQSATGLVNATEVGMVGHPGSAIDPDFIGTQSWAFDAVYTPTDTTFLQAAKDKGLAVLTGFDLFRFMALESFRIYTGISPDKHTILPALDAFRPERTQEQ